MLHWHRLDPVNLHHAAGHAGNNAAEGASDLEGAHQICRVLAETYECPPVLARGLAARLCWTATDTYLARRREIERAEVDVRYAVRPLIEDRAPKHEVEEAAAAAANGRLPWELIFPILRAEVARTRGRRRHGGA